MADWFAFGLEGTASSGLDKVLRLQETKLQFARALKYALANPIPQAPDRIALIHDDIKSLDKTLRLRVSMLPLDRPQAWFRPGIPAEKSPIASSEHTDPIFMPFEDSHAAVVRLALPEFWRQRIVATDRYDAGFSLWGRLLALNKKLHQLNHLSAPFHDITIDEMPDAIPDELSSPALNAFVTQLCQRLKACQRDLEACYSFLWARSESFLFALHVQYMGGRGKESRADKNAPPPLPHNGRKLSPLEEALRFMNFSRLPNFADLRARYRVMAQALHPDRGGNEDHFKLLSLHYQALLKQSQRF
ncbi:MAG: hypothetical protein H7249_20345 [Chitinophagaceae bacterium]|nr:hypothetical protein [Oligoflexus sp.]